MKNELLNGLRPLPELNLRANASAQQVRIATPRPKRPIRAIGVSGIAKKSNKKTLTIEWKHLDRGGKTCDRCGDTGFTLRKTVRALRRHCRLSGVSIKFKETKLPARRLPESNAILFNSVSLEVALGDANVIANGCDSCSTLVGEASQCRAVRRHGSAYTAIPENLVREAACRVAGCPCPVGTGAGSVNDAQTMNPL